MIWGKVTNLFNLNKESDALKWGKIRSEHIDCEWRDFHGKILTPLPKNTIYER